MDQSDSFDAEALAQHRRPFLGRGGVDRLALLDQRADPIGLAARRQMARQPVHHIVELGIADHQVSTGVRPGGISSIRLTSISP